jgi:hypothetical protein
VLRRECRHDLGLPDALGALAINDEHGLLLMRELAGPDVADAGPER